MDEIRTSITLPQMPKNEDDFSDWQGQLSSRNYDFKTQIDNIVIRTEQRLLSVVKTSIIKLVNEAQTLNKEGGKMRADTGFLRSSGIASLNAPPVGASVGRKRNKGETGLLYQWDGEAIETTLGRLKIGDTFYFGWTAHYAKYREAFDGFLESAVQKWQSFVDKEVAYFRKKDGA